MKKSKLVVSVGIALLIVVGIIVSVTQKNRPDDVRSNDVIKIGYIGPVSGPAAVLGVDAVATLEILADQINDSGGINGKRIEIVVEDDQYVPTKTLSAYSKLTSFDDIELLIVSSYGGLFSLANRAEHDHAVIIDPLDCDRQIAELGENIFCIAKDDDEIGYVLADYAIAQGKKKAGVLHTTADNFMPYVKDAFIRRFKEKGGSVQTENYLATDSDFKTPLMKLAQSEVLVLLGYDELGIAMKQARDLGLNAPFIGTATVTSPPLQETAKGNAEGTVFPFWKLDPTKSNPEIELFQKRFQEKMGRKPIVDMFTYAAYDTMQILTKKILPNVTANNKPSRVEQIKNNLLQIKDFPGVSGTLTMDQSGKITGIVITPHRLENGIPVEIK